MRPKPLVTTTEYFLLLPGDMDGRMSTRKVEVPPNQDMDEAVRDDVLEHSDSPTYEALFVIARLDSQYDYQVTCENFAAVCKDPTYIARCIIQAKFENRHPSTAGDWFPNPQPFKTIRVPKEKQNRQQ
jgi:hypothetical protein